MHLTLSPPSFFSKSVIHSQTIASSASYTTHCYFCRLLFEDEDDDEGVPDEDEPASALHSVQHTW
jgi:hypothetical protein